jgi:hypothetical protein
VQVLDVVDGQVTAINVFLAFLEPDRLFPSLGLPLHIDA